ncbi:hypothetical protein [Pelagicoccus sp. SDUM812002]|uniref:hypothetical protein n=1 Tax=Pelagicoccus sp. SDUM812002 TaxID=3041266 RepID=UPI00280EE597|nr:hypothetical protein [Pelagicoccus sp. SDUM812002]MDQ8183962.1 hypothetical protein [Pelagicoccus sp. SDUM812002]
MNLKRVALKGIKRRRRLSAREFNELRSQLEAGNTKPSFDRMQQALEARNWDFLYEWSYSHLTLSHTCSRNLIYYGIASARLGRSEHLCIAIYNGWTSPQSSKELAREAAIVSGMLGLRQYSLAFFSIHQLLSHRKEGHKSESPELIECFQSFLKDCSVEPQYRCQQTDLTFPYYFTLLIQEIADRIPTPSDSLDLYL